MPGRKPENVWGSDQGGRWRRSTGDFHSLAEAEAKAEGGACFSDDGEEHGGDPDMSTSILGRSLDGRIGMMAVLGTDAVGRGSSGDEKSGERGRGLRRGLVEDSDSRLAVPVMDGGVDQDDSDS